MTTPRCIRPGTTWFLTRRTTRRHFLLRPDATKESQNIYWYVTAVMAAKFGIQLHAVQVLSTHVHEVVTDVRGNLPAFLRERNRLWANALKYLRKWPEEVFQRAQGSCVQLYGYEAIVQKIGYTLANCVEAGLVREPAAWPGVTTLPDDLGRKTIEAQRPSFYFDAKNPAWPAVAQLPITMPPALDAMFGSAARAKVTKAVSAIIAAASAVTRAVRRGTASLAELVTVPVTKRSKSFETFGATEPYFAAGGNPGEAARAKKDRATFLDAYRAALGALKAGAARVAFPLGTWRWTEELLPSRAMTLIAT